ncbi:glycoside hydrolase family 76 protein [Amycolatopsis sp. PS_44_ISF1]|uniref:glycoside hydrolase family 76 protein n=1 Tax=Amycolatopsis sp. PS_44_ISF1 TaxID=2974917 RepID=UPI0028E07DEA|nr:glycoside hydrolase family 76 protein [Amycolatopsis sp. PS_44_ISF1]MDT8911409.1 glycoside hydrolase family 76 protein [Amycolatopsis sp. PS_44_ISF1]
MRTLLVLLLVLGGLTPGPVAAAAADAVCVTSCDTLDPSRAAHESFPLPDLVINGRVLRLHASDPDDMAWASIDDANPGDAVWLDRSWDGGATWDGLLGRATVPGTWTGTRTLMYNLTDPAHHRRGLLRACGDAHGVGCTAWIYPAVCDTACDGTAPGTGDSQPVAPATLSGRTIRLHFDGRGLGWAGIETGGAGDEVWLDRSWDAGSSWPDGSSLGRTSVASGAAGTHTTAFATRDPRGRLYGGSVRACGREAAHSEGSCTAWARPVTTRAAAAADALMWSYEPATAWWPSSWWNSAVAVTAMADAGGADPELARVFDVNRVAFPAGARSSDPIDGHFTSRAIDDTEWWGLAWIAVYDRTHDQRYLTEATTIADYVNGFWDTGTCGGGVWWDRERTYKNAVSTGLYLRLAASLHRRIAGDAVWGQRAKTAGDWYLGSGLINASGLVNDGLTSSCANNGQTVWTYNQGLGLGGLVELWRATGQTSYLDAARRLGDAAMTGLTSGGVLAESCDTGSNSCDDNQKQFKGIFMRYFGDLADATGSAPYRAFAQKQADTLWAGDRDAQNRIGQRWAGSTPNVTDWRTQASGLEAVLAAG